MRNVGRIVPAPYKPEFTADFSIDGHSHIQSGATAPLPLIWSQAKDIRLERTTLDVIAGIVLPSGGGKVQRQTTEKIADDLVKELGTTYKECSLRQKHPYKLGLKKQSTNSEKPA